MVKWHYGMLDCKRGWYQSHSRYGIWLLVRCYFRFWYKMLIEYWSSTCSSMLTESLLQASLAKDSSISISCVSWSPDGNLIGMCHNTQLVSFRWIRALLHSISVVAGVAFTKHLIHLYANQGLNDLRQHLEACFNSISFAFSTRYCFFLYWCLGSSFL